MNDEYVGQASDLVSEAQSEPENTQGGSRKFYKYTLLNADALLANLTGVDGVAGQDLSMSNDFDLIREARREDDASLSQGVWETNVKVADWRKVESLCREILQTKSKDLQVAVWLGESLVKQHGWQGIREALQLIEEIQLVFWSDLHPALLEQDYEERAGKLNWLNKRYGELVRQIPIAKHGGGHFDFNHLISARLLQNTKVRDPQAYEQQVNEGKVTLEIIERAEKTTGADFYRELRAEVRAAKAQFEVFYEAVDSLFGQQCPSLADCRKNIDECCDAIVKIAKNLGVPEDEQEQVANGEHADDANDGAQAALRTAAGGVIQSREDALLCLQDVATYFRSHEPHSPVAFLAEKAAAWGRMSLPEWLATVIKEPGVLAFVNEAIGVNGARVDDTTES